MIVLIRNIGDKIRHLQRKITEADIINKKRELGFEIRHLEESITIEEVNAALQIVVSESYTVAPESVKTLRISYG